MAITGTPFEEHVMYSKGFRSGSIDALGHALQKAWWSDSDVLFRELMEEGLRRYGDDFRAEAEKRGIKL